MEQIRIAFDLGDHVRVSPPLTPGNTLDVRPDDLTKFAPTGNGVYGHQGREGMNPFMGAPPQEACGGVLYFDNHISRADLEALVRILEVERGPSQRPDKAFAVYTAEAKIPAKEGYLAQVRLVTKFGLRFAYNAISATEYESFREQELSMVEVLWAFIEHERKRWGTAFWEDEEKGLMGLFGGDGDFAREKLSFGFMLENNYYNICRIWSRAWLVTK